MASSEVWTKLEDLQFSRKNDTQERASLSRDNKSLRSTNAEMRDQLRDALARLAKLQIVETQAKNQQDEYMRLMDENTQLMKLIEKLDAQKEELLSQLLAKSNRDKKRD